MGYQAIHLKCITITQSIAQINRMRTMCINLLYAYSIYFTLSVYNAYNVTLPAEVQQFNVTLFIVISSEC